MQGFFNAFGCFYLESLRPGSSGAGISDLENLRGSWLHRAQTQVVANAYAFTCVFNRDSIAW